MLSASLNKKHFALLFVKIMISTDLVMRTVIMIIVTITSPGFPDAVGTEFESQY